MADIDIIRNEEVEAAWRPADPIGLCIDSSAAPAGRVKADEQHEQLGRRGRAKGAAGAKADVLRAAINSKNVPTASDFETDGIIMVGYNSTMYSRREVPVPANARGSRDRDLLSS